MLVSHMHGDHVGDPKKSQLVRFGAQRKVGGVTISTVPAAYSNGLVAYLSGDTGITAEQESVVRDHYGAELVVINIGDTFTTGPSEAAWVVNKLIKPKSVIASHANQPSTSGGKVLDGTRLARFSKMSEAPVHVPLSGRDMAFDGSGKCVSGC